MTEPSEKGKSRPDAEVTGSGIPRFVVPLVVGVAVVSVVAVSVKRSEPPPAAGSADLQSEYPTCEAIARMFVERNAEQNCPSSGALFAKRLCEKVYREKAACEPQVQANFSCLKEQPKTLWRCSEKGELIFEAPACEAQVDALKKCANF